MRLARRETGLSPPVKYFYLPFQGGASLKFVDHLCFFLVFVMLSCAVGPQNAPLHNMLLLVSYCYPAYTICSAGAFCVPCIHNMLPEEHIV